MLRFLLGLLMLMTVLIGLAYAEEYTLVDLGAETIPLAVDDLDQVVGQRTVVVPTSAGDFRTRHVVQGFVGSLQDLGAPDGPTFPGSSGLAQSDTVVVGSATFPGSDAPNAFVRTGAEGFVRLPAVSEARPFSEATGVNVVETIVGYTHHQLTPQGGVVPILWVGRQLATLPLLTPLPSLFDGQAEGINSAGDITGHVRTAANDEHAVLWPVEGGVFDLDGQAGRQSFGLAINATRMVVGDAQGRAFTWSPSVGFVLLPFLPLGLASQALGVNDSGHVVGWTRVQRGDAQPPSKATRWKDGAVVDLGTLVSAPGWTLEQATAMNTHGTIVGTGRLDGVAHGFLLYPISLPPPSLVPAPVVSPPVLPPPLPVADAGPAQAVLSGAVVTLDARHSWDPLGDALTFAWAQMSGILVTLVPLMSATPAFVAPEVTEETMITFAVVITAGGRVSLVATTSVMIRPIPAPAVPPQAPVPIIPSPEPSPMPRPPTAPPLLRSHRQHDRRGRAGKEAGDVRWWLGQASMGRCLVYSC